MVVAGSDIGRNVMSSYGTKKKFMTRLNGERLEYKFLIKSQHTSNDHISICRFIQFLQQTFYGLHK